MIVPAAPASIVVVMPGMYPFQRRPAYRPSLGIKRQRVYTANMGTKNISLPDELERYVEAKVASGEYAHASEVVRDGLRLLMQREAEKLDWLRAAIAEGTASADRGEVSEFDDAMMRRIVSKGRALATRSTP